MIIYTISRQVLIDFSLYFLIAILEFVYRETNIIEKYVLCYFLVFRKITVNLRVTQRLDIIFNHVL